MKELLGNTADADRRRESHPVSTADKQRTGNDVLIFMRGRQNHKRTSQAHQGEEICISS